MSSRKRIALRIPIWYTGCFVCPIIGILKQHKYNFEHSVVYKLKSISKRNPNASDR